MPHTGRPPKRAPAGTTGAQTLRTLRREKTRARREKHRAAGLCILLCLRPATPCTRCGDDPPDSERRLTCGLCNGSGRAATCAECREKMAAKMQARRAGEVKGPTSAP